MSIKNENQTKTALLVIDVQRDLFRKSHPIYRADELLNNINSLVERAHQACELVDRIGRWNICVDDPDEYEGHKSLLISILPNYEQCSTS
jgi:hypothetical protein